MVVVPLGPGKFYGGSLPRPRFYTDTKFNPDRVDPPLPVMDPLLSRANEAHWSMGGLSFERLRLQDRIEGKVEKLRPQVGELRDSPEKDLTIDRSVKRRRFLALFDSYDESDDRRDGEFLKEKVKKAFSRGAVRNLGDDFEMVAEESSAVREKRSTGVGANVMKIVEQITDGVGFAGEKRVKKILKNGRGVVQSGTRTSPRSATGTRTSPRLAKCCSS
ncbi:hypothetical protein SLEP1_g36864 [Rubroshorea leprosula]|uniref:Uncharacterized protein n=1 Tax=Rubroshorea leprosula TaxID=152421 RepID=A0AAV5KTB7_9ROSI|nr:hypothetical protein SLEP1_g36864 [Rubroshorea leprosula]